MDLNSSAFVAPPELVRAVSRCATPIDCPLDRYLFRQGDDPTGLYVLLSGRVTMILESVPCPFEVVHELESPGSLLGLPAIIGDKPYSLTAVAHAHAEVSFVKRDDFSRLMLSEPALGMMILQVLAAEVRSARAAISEYPARIHRARSLRRKAPLMGLTEASR